MLQNRGLALYWRLAFWVAVIHLVVCGLLASLAWAPEAEARTLALFPLASVGLARAVALWLFENCRWIYVALAASNVASLWLIWRLAHGRPSGRILAVYLPALGTILAAHVAATAYLVSGGDLMTPQATYGFVWNNFEGVAITALILAVPMGLLFAGWLWEGHAAKAARSGGRAVATGT